MKTIRRFEINDTERIMEIWLSGNLDAHDFVVDTYWKSNYDIMKEMLPQAEIFVCEIDGIIRGFVGMQENYLAGIFVDKKYRSEGIGKSLLEHIKEIYDTVTLNVYKKNNRAVEFYLREGFSVASEGIDEDTGEKDYILVWKRQMRLIKVWKADVLKAYELYNTFEENENGFVNDAYGFSLKEFESYVQTRKDSAAGINLKAGHVPDTIYILEDEGAYIGIFKLRHYLNDALKEGAGHIGYGISPKYRGKGYAARGLKMTIEIAKGIIPEKQIYMSVHKDNPASLKVQIKNGAYIHHETEEEYYTRVEI